MLRLDASALGGAQSIAVAAGTQRTYWPDYQNDPLTFEEQQDNAPDVQWPDPGGEWIEVEA